MTPTRLGTSAHHHPFINDGQLLSAPSMSDLLRTLEPVSTETPCKSIMKRFLADGSLYALPVIDELARPLALVDRKLFIEFLSKPYGHDIFGGRPILDLLEYKDYKSGKSLIIEAATSIEDAAHIMVAAGVEQMVTGFLICRDGKYLGVANGHDLLSIITQRKQAELYHLAHYDSLTSIPNRALLNDRLEQACLDADRRKRIVALLFVDVDRFKSINDSLGHSAGDLVLCKLVERLKASARRTDTVARLAGDEFVILMGDLSGTADVDLVGRRLVESMNEPIDVHGHSLIVTVSVGSAAYPADGTNAGTLLSRADAAMYSAKAIGRNNYRKYSPDAAIYNPPNVLLVNDLRQAIERSELVLHYQPQVDLATGEACGLEALVRWHHPVRGMIRPSEFIPIAEESGLIIALGESVLHQALGQMCIWKQLDLPPLKMSINISAPQFYRRDFPAYLQGVLATYEICPTLIELELTESVLMMHAGGGLHTLEEVRELGVCVAIDDFGTGFSSLSYLRRFPIDRLKIDQSFVRDIHDIPVNKAIAQAIIALGRSLSLHITAEGIENVSERKVLQQLGCSEGQGFLFSPALTAAELVVWLDRNRNNAKQKTASAPGGLIQTAAMT